ncbi:hypothetical protein GCM10023196_073590 [Actinoallomurus vinaceus]|uniref:phospholipase D n=2 Tax=Actinoallomurus vinaceus TaxID=1080074 RepID=A0ABP8UJU6_9ACTN
MSGAAPLAALRPSAVFNVPSGSAAEQNAIAHHVNQLAAGAPRGALIRIAVFMFTSKAFAQTLIDAKRRGARVQLVVDASTRDNDAYRSVERALGTSRKSSSWVVACHSGCIGDTIMHNKFFLFSQTGRARDVVVQSSANLTTRNRVNAWNNAFTISDARLYQAYGRYFAALAARHHERDHYRVAHSGRVTAYTFPRAGDSARTDTLYGLLGHVGCARGTAVLVTTFNLSRTAVAERLWSLSHQGCDVRVIYTNLSQRAREILQQDGGPQLLSSHYLYFDPDTGDEVDAFAHSKYVLIDGTYAGRTRKVVITGSPNYTEPALRHNDETMITIEGADIYGAYQRNFARLWQAAQSHYQLHGLVPDPDDPAASVDE